MAKHAQPFMPRFPIMRLSPAPSPALSVPAPIGLPDAPLPTALFPLLRLLDDGRVHSGEALARALGVSRASIHNLMQAAEAAGLAFHALPGKGYRLTEAYDWLDTEALGRALAAAGADFHLEVHDQLASTNSHLMAQALAGAPHRTVCYCSHQYAGRGRRGRAWLSGLGGGITFSVLWRLEGGIGQASALSLAVGLAVARALEHERPLQLKWPNDILAGFRKLAGILVEIQGDALGPAWAVIGIGINQRMADSVREHIDQAVASLTEIEVALTRTEILARVLLQLDRTLAQFEITGFASLAEDWNARHAYHGRRVALHLPDGSRVEGDVAGVDAQGALRLRLAGGGESRFHAGELRMRPLHG